MKGEGCKMSARADGPTVVDGADSASGVLDDSDSAWLTQRPHTVEVCRHARLVDQDHGAGTIRQMRRDRNRGEILRLDVYVGEDRLGADVTYRVGGCYEGQRGDDHFIAGSD